MTANDLILAIGMLVSGVTGISPYRPAQSPVIKVAFDESDTLVGEANEKRLTSDGLPRMFVLANETACLNFLHIPKTAGSSMEVTGNKKGKHWGMFDGRLNCDGLFHCPHHPLHSFHRCCPMRDGNACSIWHTPPKQSKKLKDSYAQCETFCVVREPYSRFKSEHLWQGGECSAAALKRTIDEKLEQIKKHPYLDDCHYVPQVEYWLKGEGCQHVIKFENLIADFAALVARFGFQAEVRLENSSPKCKLQEEIEEKQKEIEEKEQKVEQTKEGGRER